MSDVTEHFDILIIGAGISGLGAGHYVTTELAGKSFAILEGRETFGGTWDLFKYPGIRSDSDLFTFGYEFKPWRSRDTIADAQQILDYLGETIDENGLADKIRYRHRVVGAQWSSDEARWTVEIEHGESAEKLWMSANFLFCGSGYYRYDEGFTPQFPGRERFTGPVVHPQHWPEDLDYTGKNVVVIGSGATAVTLIPAMAERAAHVTMLQRTPSFIMPVPKVDKLAVALRRWLGPRIGHSLTRARYVLQQRVVFEFAQRFPNLARKAIRSVNTRMLPAGYPVDVHFNPPYNPWDQRLCAVPDGDLFRSIRKGDATVVTDRIATFTETGISLESGAHLDADLIITATGLNLRLLGGITLKVDGRPVDLAETVIHRGTMLSGVPNFAVAIGYTNSSWTLKVGLLCRYFCQLVALMDERGADTAVAVADPDMATRPALDFAAGYVQRAIHEIPRQGAGAEWAMSMSFLADRKKLGRGVRLGEGTGLQLSHSTRRPLPVA